jgi:hypothetical protein
MDGNRTSLDLVVASLRADARAVIKDIKKPPPVEAVEIPPTLSVGKVRTVAWRAVFIVVTGCPAVGALPFGYDAFAGKRLVTECSLIGAFLITVAAGAAHRLPRAPLKSGAILRGFAGYVTQLTAFYPRTAPVAIRVSFAV